jgi:hypothetical protein
MLLPGHEGFCGEGEKGGSAQAGLLAPYYEMAKLPRTGKFDKYVYPYKPEYHDDPRFLSPRPASGARRDGGVQALLS